MTGIKAFVEKRSFVISLLLLGLYIALFFIPYVAATGYWKDYAEFEDCAFRILKSICPPPNYETNVEELQLYSFAILFVFLSLWITQIVAIFLSKKRPFSFLASIIPFSVVYFGTIYMVASWAEYDVPPSAGVFIMTLIYAFLLLVVVAWMQPFIKKAIDSRPPREHKPTKEERIAELEARVRELENRD